MVDHSIESDPEFYARPVFRVASVADSLEYYCDKLGFKSHWKFRDSPDQPPIIAQVGRNRLHLILDGGTAISRPGARSVLALSLFKEDQLAELYRELEKRGASLSGPPKRAYWQEGIWFFEARDLDDNILQFAGDESPALLDAWG